MKSLNTVQKIAKALKVIYTIGLVLCIIGLLGAIIFGVIILVAQQSDPNYVVYEGITIAEIAPSGIKTMALLAIVSLGELICQARGRRFYKYELKVGTPFDAKVVKKCKALGWTYIIMAIVVNIAALIYVLLMNGSNVFVVGSGLFVGIGYLIITAVLRYGNDILENKQ